VWRHRKQCAPGAAGAETSEPVLKRPSFQFYPADWRNNGKLRRCSPAARGSWMDALCLLHDSDEYGVLRWPLIDIANAVGIPCKLLEELAAKGVLKGGNDWHGEHAYTPVHARVKGAPVVLLTGDGGPCWFSSRMVDDEYLRHHRGLETRFKTTPDSAPSQRQGAPEGAPKGEPKGASQGDGASSSSSSSSKSKVLASAIVEAVDNLQTHSSDKSVNGKDTAKPERPKWWLSDQGIDSKAREMGIKSKPGEDYKDLRQRIFDKINYGKTATQ
jgi:hypothetical protein